MSLDVKNYDYVHCPLHYNHVRQFCVKSMRVYIHVHLLVCAIMSM